METRSVRKTQAEQEEIEKWEQSISRSDGGSATDVYLEQNVLQLAQPLRHGTHSLLVPHEVRMSACGRYIQWRGRGSVWYDGAIQFMKGRVSPINSLQSFILLSGKMRQSNKEGDLPNHKRIVEFVTKWGPLGLRPELHSADTPEDEAKHGAWLSEPIKLYQTHAKVMWSLLTIAAQVHQGLEPTQEEWEAAKDWATLPDIPYRVRAENMAADNAASLAFLVEMHYLKDINVRPMLTVINNRPLLTIDITSEEEISDWYMYRDHWIEQQVLEKTKGMERRGIHVDAVKLRAEVVKQFRPDDECPSMLLNCLVFQLIATLTSGLNRCSRCLSPYTPTRKPRGENHYCEECQPLAHRERSKISSQKRKKN